MSSVTFKAVVSPRRKDGTFPVRIRVTFKGVSRRLPTNLVASPGDLTRSLHLKSPTLLNKTAALINELRDTLADVSPFALEGWDVDRVVAHIRRSLEVEDFRLDFFEFADGFLAGKTPPTRGVYDAALHSMERYLGKRELDINEITHRLLLDWMAWTDKQPKAGTRKPQKGGQSTRNAVRLGHIFAEAKRRYNDDDRTLIPRSPFEGLPYKEPPAAGARPLTRDEMQLIVNAQATGTERTALDVFIVSFATMGANMADLWEARVSGPEWVYTRKKTRNRRQDRAEMRVSVPPEIAPHLARLGKGHGGWWLASLRDFATDTNGCTHKVNRALKSFAKRNGLEPFTFYAARKAWATLARSIGVEKALVDECLTHVGDFPVTDIYARRDYSRMNEANRQVLTLLNWHD